MQAIKWWEIWKIKQYIKDMQGIQVSYVKTFDNWSKLCEETQVLSASHQKLTDRNLKLEIENESLKKAINKLSIDQVKLKHDQNHQAQNQDRKKRGRPRKAHK